MIPSSIELIYLKYIKYCFLINDVKDEKELDEIAASIKNEMFLFGNAKSELENYIGFKKTILNSRNIVYDDSELIENQYYYIYSSADKKITIPLVDENCNNVSPKNIPVVARAYNGILCNVIGYNTKISLNPMKAYEFGPYILADHAVRIIDKDELEKIILMICHMSDNERANYEKQLRYMTGNWKEIILKKQEK